ncbi:MAG: DUF3301 domain-containing protein [Lysobacterales bacterium]
MTGLLLFVVFACVALAWWQFLQGRETARYAAGKACQEHGLLLMDDTVVLDGIELLSTGKFCHYGLRYRFDFAFEGILQKGSKVLVSPGRTTTVVIPTSTGQVIEEI